MSTTKSALINELVDAATAVHDAAKAMKNCKDNSRKIAKLALEIATSVENTAMSALYRGETADIAISVVAALSATKDCLVQCAGFMKDVAAKGALTRHFRKGLTADTVGGYLAAVEGLHQLLKIHEHVCGLMLEPFAGLSIDESCTKDILSANIKTMDAAYDGLKSTINVMVNMTDGLPWPVKAAPQTFLYVLQMFEDCQDVRPKITSLLFAIQTLWKIVGRVSPDVVADDEDMRQELSTFFEALQRIAVRLHIVLRVGQVKRALAIHTIRDCLALEEQRLNETGKTIMTVFSVQTLNEVRRLDKKIEKLQPVVPASSYDVDVSISAMLPPKPTVFHGRDATLDNAVRLLVQLGTVRLAVLGAGGMGKTTIALAFLYDDRVIDRLDDRRLFLSCESLADANGVIISLAKLLGLPPSGDLLAAVVLHLTAMPHTLLVLDNIETVWLVDGAPADAVEAVLGRLAQIPSLSLMITCRGNILPQSVEWSNADSASLAPFTLDAALQTFQDRAGQQLTGSDEDSAKKLLEAVDRMPLAVSLLGQLARRGTPVDELLIRWNDEHSALLCTHGGGRFNNMEVSIELSINKVCAADQSGESLRLLSLCCMLPDGLHPEVFEKLRPQFRHIGRARETLSAYALAVLDTDRVLKTLSPVRHHVLQHHPAEQSCQDALHSAYLDIAKRLPEERDEHFREAVASAVHHMGNLSSLLPTLVGQPSQPIVDAVVGFTLFTRYDHPTVTVASVLLSHLGPYPRWKAECLWAIGRTQLIVGHQRRGIDRLAAASQLYFELGDRPHMAMCKYYMADAHRVLSEYDHAESLFNEALEIHLEMEDSYNEAKCRERLGDVARMKRDRSAAIAHLIAARDIFKFLGNVYDVAYTSCSLGLVYLDQRDVNSAKAELEAARSTFIGLGIPIRVAQCTRCLSRVHKLRGNFDLAERCLEDAVAFYRKIGYRLGLAFCAEDFGHLRWCQQRPDEAIAHFKPAIRLFEALQMKNEAQECRDWVARLEPIARPTIVDSP